jgi:2-octaprenyl-3-methyl-6-methoxy-1,4-benzoquinol hydroxylase/2-octaprenylphenol hydroxylase
MNERIFDVVVIGAGMVGSAAACLLSRAGFSVAVVEGREPMEFDPEQPVGLRVSAFSPGSADILAEAGAWRQIEKQRHCPYLRMHVEDRDERSILEFSAPEFGMECLGVIVENDLVQWTLWQSLQAMGGVEIVCPDRLETLERKEGLNRVLLNSGRELSCRLLVGADGANSEVRKALGIGQRHWEYGQQGLVSVIHTARPNPKIAWQRFLDNGPLAFLPLQEGASSIVWSLPETEARRLLELDDQDFLAELQSAAAPRSETGVEALAADWPGDLLSCGPRASFALTMRLSDTYTAPGAVLIGDAAHVVHPLAGQGVNLGLLDAAGLVESMIGARSAQDDFAGDKALGAFSRWRRSEAEVMASGIHGLRGLFMPPALAPLRRLGLGLVSRSWTAKEAFIRRAAGRNRNAPALARGKALTELLHGQ